MPLTRKAIAGSTRARAAVAGLAVASVITGALLAGDRDVAAEQTDNRPNIVVILTDDQDTSSLRVMKQTRRLLVRKGVKFNRHYATFPLCCPSRASYLTGQFSHNHGVRGNRQPEGGFLELDDSATAAVSMRAAGYKTAWIGKFLNGYGNYARGNPDDIPDGFNRFYAGLTSRMYDWVVNDDGEIRRLPKSDQNYQTDVYTRQSKRFMRAKLRRGKPFFLTIAPLAPHGEPKRDAVPNPRPAPRHANKFTHAKLPHPASFNEKDVSDKPLFIRRQNRLDIAKRRKVRDRYRSRLASLLAVDDMVHAVVRELRRGGELDNTWIIFTSDNGYSLGEHRHTGKTLLYEESAKVPMIVRGPGVPRGATHSEPTANIDLMPTILQLGDASAQAPVDGVSVRSVARNPGAETGRVLLLENRNSAGVQDGRYSYLEHDTDDDGQVDEYEFYDLKTDRAQMDNLHTLDAPVLRPDVVSERPGLVDVRDSLADQLDDLRDCVGAQCH